MGKHVDFARGDIFPASFTDALQEMVSALSANLRFSGVGGTTLRLNASASQRVSLVIDGKWRWVDANIDTAFSAGGSKDIYAVASANSFANTPEPDTDNTDYSFGIQLVATGGSPSGNHNGKPIAHSLKLGTATVTGGAISAINVTYGPAHIQDLLAVASDVAALKSASNYAWMYRSSDISTPSFPNAWLPFNTKTTSPFDSDPKGLLGISGAPVSAGRILLPAGMWWIFSTIQWSPPSESSTNALTLTLRKNGSEYRVLDRVINANMTGAGGAYDVVAQGGALAYSNGSDVFDFTAVTDGYTGGGGMGTFRGGSQKSWAEVFRAAAAAPGSMP